MWLRRSVLQRVGQLGDFLTDSQFGRSDTLCVQNASAGFPAASPASGPQAAPPPANLPSPVSGMPPSAITAPPPGATYFSTIASSPPAAAPLQSLETGGKMEMPAETTGSHTGDSASRQSPAETPIPQSAPPVANPLSRGTPSSRTNGPWSASPGPAHALGTAFEVGNAPARLVQLESTKTPVGHAAQTGASFKPTPGYTWSSTLDLGRTKPPGPTAGVPLVSPATAGQDTLAQEPFQLLTTNQSNGVSLELAMQLGLPLCVPARLANRTVCVPVVGSTAGAGNASAFNTSASIAIATQQPLTLVPLDDLAMAPSDLPQMPPVSSFAPRTLVFRPSETSLLEHGKTSPVGKRNSLGLLREGVPLLGLSAVKVPLMPCGWVFEGDDCCTTPFLSSSTRTFKGRRWVTSASQEGGSRGSLFHSYRASRHSPTHRILHPHRQLGRNTSPPAR